MRPSRNQELINALAVEIKARRNELRFSQEELASRMDVDRPYLSLIEVGKKQPTISVLYRLAIALELSFDELAKRIDKRYRSGQAHDR